LEETIQKKSKQIYELTVELGAVKEENNQLKKDQDFAKESLEEKLVAVQAKLESTEEKNIELDEENQTLKATIEQFKQIA